MNQLNLLKIIVALFFFTGCYTPKTDIEGDKYPELKTFKKTFVHYKLMDIDLNLKDSDNIEFFETKDLDILLFKTTNNNKKIILFKENKITNTLVVDENFVFYKLTDGKIIGVLNDEILEINIDDAKVSKKTAIISDINNDPDARSIRNDSISKLIKTIEYSETIIDHRNLDHEAPYLLVNNNTDSTFYISKYLFIDSINFASDKFIWQKNKELKDEPISNQLRYSEKFNVYDQAVVDNKKCSSGNHFVFSFGYCPVYMKYISMNVNMKSISYKVDERTELIPSFFESKNGFYVIDNKSLYYLPNN